MEWDDYYKKVELGRVLSLSDSDLPLEECNGMVLLNNDGKRKQIHLGDYVIKDGNDLSVISPDEFIKLGMEGKLK